MYLWIAAGSALGGIGRYAFGQLASYYLPAAFPWGTWMINIIGSFIIGIAAALVAGNNIPYSQEIKQFVMVGLCGGFTTFSSFSLQTLEMLQEQRYSMAALYSISSVSCCVFAVWLGYWLAALKVG
ncbi:MAG: fluoride efflux transporter CrcB [Alphaproteobacteria bacterium]